MQEGPLVSVVTTTYNRSRFICDAIDSALAQDVDGMEIVLIDDGSTDDTSEKLSRYGPPVRVHRQENAGMEAARNRGLAVAAGRYVALLDSDDVWLPGKLAADLEILEADEGVGLVCSMMEVIDTDGLRTGVVKPRYAPGVTFRDALRSGSALTSSFTFRRDMARSFGFFDEGLRRFDDLNFLLEFTLRGRVVCRDEITTLYRDHPGNLSKDAAGASFGMYALYRKWLGRCPDRESRLVCRKKLRKNARALYRMHRDNGEFLPAARYLAAWLRARVIR